MTEQQPPLPEDWADRDSRDGFYEYIELCRKEAREGKPLPVMFRPREAAE